MNSPAVDVLLFRLGAHRLAVELDLVSSVLSPDDATGMDRIDPRPHLLSADADDAPLPEPDADALVGLLDMAGPPRVVLLGEVLGATTLDRSNVLAVPGWLADFLPDVLRPAFAWIDQKVVWLLDLDTLSATSPH